MIVNEGSGMPVICSAHVITIAYFHAALKSNLQNRTTQNKTLTICDINGKPFVTCIQTMIYTLMRMSEHAVSMQFTIHSESMFIS